MWRFDPVSGALAPGWSTFRILLLVVSMTLAVSGSWLLSVARPTEMIEIGEIHEVELIEAGQPDQNPAR